MTFTESYNYLLSLQSLPRKEYMRDPKHCNIYLKRLQFFLDILGNPEKKIPHYIHVTGTSGKGSICLMLNSILTEARFKTGLSISPHPVSITERWQIGKKIMTKKEFIELIEFIKPKLDEYVRTTPYDMLSFFEICEAIGFLYFVNKKVDWAILEVGCGGRYDASNVIPYKDIAVITNIGLDHTNILGNDKKLIAYEKAGIINNDCEVFTMEKNQAILKILKQEAKKYSKNINKILTKYYLINSDLFGNQFRYDGDEYKLSILGEHQIENSILAIKIAKHLNIPESTIKKGLQKTKLPLRMEIVSKNPRIILDGAHNPDKIKTTVNAVKNLLSTSPLLYKERDRVRYRNVHLIVAFTADKNISKMIKQLITLNPQSIACTRYTNNPFRIPANPKDLADKFKKLLPKSKIEVFLDPQDAFAWSKNKTKTSDLLLVTGSIFLSGEIRSTVKL